MKSPREKYTNDPEFHHLVNLLESLIEKAQFTPSELREAIILASINYEMRYARVHTVNPRLLDALDTLEAYVNTGKQKCS